MVAYAIIQVEVTDPGKFDEYKVQVPPIIAQYGGRYLARGGACEVLNGQWPVERTVILEFPSIADARAWHDSPEYAAPRALRDQAAKVTVVVIEGI